MKKYLSKIFIIFVIAAGIFSYNEVNSFADPTENVKDSENTITATANTGTLENIYLAKLPGKERIQLVVSKQPVIDVKSKVSGSYVIKLEDMVVPENLCRSLGEGELNNIINVVPSQQLVNGKNWVYINVAIKKVVPYSIRQEGQNVFVDFNILSLEDKKTSVTGKALGKKKSFVKVSSEKETIDEVKKDEKDEEPAPVKKDTDKKMTDRIISLDFQDADIKSVLRLMAEYGNISIVSSDDVKGNITLSMKNVPWTKALDTILEINSLTKKEEDNVIIVTTMERRKKDDDAKIKAIDDAEQRKVKERNVLAEKGLLKQIMIEAKIVEATEEFVRDLGVQWGFGNQQKVRINNGKYGLGVTGGSNTSTDNQQTMVYPNQIGFTDTDGNPLEMAAVNFASSVSSPAIGLVFGGATGFLETQLAALETNSTGKIISAPKVVTMEGIKAVIKQGDEVPYITPASGTSPATVSFKEALLKLEVTPKITADGKISMDIKASNDTPDWSKADLNPQGNPPIVKSEVESKVVINDGDTIVIGGILKSSDSVATSGWPWLQKIPVLGWLFKQENIIKSKRQLLVFVTPKVLKSDVQGESPEKIINP
jgi:type IV pilus assembly protein PilQ